MQILAEAHLDAGMEFLPASQRRRQDPRGCGGDRGDLELARLEAEAMRTDRRARFAWLIAARASGRKFCPAIVRRTPRGSRSRSGPPSSASKTPICCDSDGWATSRRSDARVKEPSSAMTTKYSS